MQDWWTASDRRHRRRHDRLRHGHRQGRRPLRLPLQPAQEPGELRAGDRPRRPRRRAVDLRAARLPRRRARRSRTSPTATRRRREALAGLLDELLAHEPGDEFDVAEYELSARHDIRPLVLETSLTYLELDGVLRQGTPFYAGYQLRARRRRARRGLRRASTRRARDFLRRVVAAGKTGPGLDDASTPTRPPPRSARSARADRRGARLPRAAGPRRAAGRRARASATRCCASPNRSSDAARRGLAERFERRERAEIERIQRVLALVTARRLPGARARRLLRRGARRAVRPLQLLPRAASRNACPAPAPLPADRHRRRRDALAALRAAHPDALAAAAAARPLPLRPHEPRDDPREAHARPALRRPRRPPLRRRAGVV